MNDTPLKSYERCIFIRAFELEVARQYEKGEVPGLVHLSTGSEVADVVLANALDPLRDQVTGSHRSHGIALAMGADPSRVAKEILGRVGGLSDGMAGTQHLMAPEAGFLLSNGIVGGQVPLAAGAALSARAHGRGGVGVAVFGDGAANQGAVLETMNLAVALKLPMVFVLYNNGMAQSTTASFSSAGTSLMARAAAFGLTVAEADGTDFSKSRQAVDAMVATARAGTAAFVELHVSRDHGHYYGDRPGGVAGSPAHDCLQKFCDALRRDGHGSGALEQTKDRAIARAETIVRQAAEAEKAGDMQLDYWLTIGRGAHG